MRSLYIKDGKIKDEPENEIFSLQYGSLIDVELNHLVAVMLNGLRTKQRVAKGSSDLLCIIDKGEYTFTGSVN